jgi:prepilin-type N-terminal cleavage/methylation domain-containing protein
MSIRHRQPKGAAGFSLIEVLLGIALMGVAVLGMAQLFLLGVWNNRRADLISNGTFLAQQQIDYLRTLTPEELAAWPDTQDEQIDLNDDGVYDCRRITTVDRTLYFYRVLIFPPNQLNVSQSALIASPGSHQVVAQVGAIINR